MKNTLFLMLFFLCIETSFGASRYLTLAEYKFARSIFTDNFPPMGKVKLFDHLPINNGRPNVLPSATDVGMIDMNMPLEMYNNPMQYTYGNYTVPGESFVHELTHVWQIYNNNYSYNQWIVIGGKVQGEAEIGGDPYTYVCGAQPYSKLFKDYNIEEQASMMNKWWAKSNNFRKGGIQGCEEFFYVTEVAPNSPLTYNTLPTGVYRIKVPGGKVLDAKASDVNNNNCPVAIFTNTPNAKEQEWEVTRLSNGNYTIKCRAGGLFLDANAGKLQENGCPLTLWGYHGGNNQQWIIRLVGKGMYHIRSAASTGEQVIDVSGADVNANNAKIHLWKSHSGANQVWAFDLVSVVSPPTVSVYVGQLPAGKQLNPGNILKSPNGVHQLVYQTDGNLVIYRNGTAVWHSHTNGQATGFCAMQGDGNLVIYKSSGVAIWATGTNTCQGTVLAMQDDGNLVIYTASGKPVWNTVTYNGLTNMNSAAGQKLCN